MGSIAVITNPRWVVDWRAGRVLTPSSHRRWGMGEGILLLALCDCYCTLKRRHSACAAGIRLLQSLRKGWHATCPRRLAMESLTVEPLCFLCSLEPSTDTRCSCTPLDCSSPTLVLQHGGLRPRLSPPESLHSSYLTAAAEPGLPPSRPPRKPRPHRRPWQLPTSPAGTPAGTETRPGYISNMPNPHATSSPLHPKALHVPQKPRPTDLDVCGADGVAVHQRLVPCRPSVHALVRLQLLHQLLVPHPAELFCRRSHTDSETNAPLSPHRPRDL